MKKTFSFSLILAKLSFLFCFGLMNVFANHTVSDADIKVPSCHNILVETETNEPCKMCIDSESIWSLPFIQNNNKIELLDLVKENQIIFTDIVLNEIHFLQGISTPDPPLETKVLHHHLIEQKNIKLLLYE